MPSKKFKGKTCVYCGKESMTADHIIAREFFLRDRREDPIKVPACEDCNREKSRLEHYLTTVLPFGARHADAAENLSSMVPSRIRRNEKLASELRTSFDA